MGKDDLYSIKITLESKLDYWCHKTETKDVDICRSCLIKEGILVEVPKEKDTQTVTQENAKTLEKNMVGILQDLGVVFEDQIDDILSDAGVVYDN